jgi:YaiO family outer membrane protein
MPALGQKNKPNPDAIYEQARKAAFDEKDYRKALDLCNQALDISPNYTDIIIFKGRIFSWDKQTDSARAMFNLAMQQKPKLSDVYVAYASMEYWNANYELANKVIETGLQYNQQNTELLMLKARVLNAQKDYKGAMDVTDAILEIESKYAEARSLQQQIKDLVAKNSVGLKYDYVKFDKQFPDPWHLITANYTRQTNMGSVTFNLNFANRFNRDGLQFELEAYPRISKTFYSYVNLGYSDDVGIFPNWRAGLSLYANLPKSFEAEAGVRYLYFVSSTYIYTLYLGKYYSNFLFGARTYLVPSPNTTVSHSYNAIARYYYGSVDEYIGLTAGYGISPDDRPFAYLLNSTIKLKTLKAGAEWRHAINRLNILTANVSIIIQEYLPNTTGNQFQAGIGYQRRF